jgi:HAD superfamily hydrolase (TIGR01509 family)
VVEAVFFDVGETLLDRTREYAAWARWLGVPPHTFSAAFGAVISTGGTVADVLGRLRPGESVGAQRAAMSAAGVEPVLDETDLYPDTRTTLAWLRARGCYVGVAGNQPREVGEQLRGLNLPADTVVVSAELGVAKPDPRFFAALVQRAGCPVESVVYVGDQLDNDVHAAAACGLQTIRVLTGPWGHLQRDSEIEAGCFGVIGTLAELPGLLAPALG